MNVHSNFIHNYLKLERVQVSIHKRINRTGKNLIYSGKKIIQTMGSSEMYVQEYKSTFCSDSNILYLDNGLGYIGICICQNSVSVYLIF